MKSKIAGLFRGFKRSNEESPSSPPSDASARSAVATPAAAVAMPAPIVPEKTHPTHSNSIMANSAPATPANEATASGDAIEIALAPVIAALPMDLKAKMISTPPPEKMISLPTDLVVQQLAFGVVKISFGELRDLAAGIFAETPSEHDSRAVSLPLQEILSRINKTFLVRRSTHQVEVSEDIAGPFGGRGQGIHFSSETSKAAPNARSSLRQTTPTAPLPPPAAAKPTPTSTAPVREVKPAQPIPFTPSEHMAPQPDSQPIAFNPRQTTPLTPPIPFANPKPTDNGGSNGHGNGSNGNIGHATLPPFKFSATSETVSPSSASPASQTLLSIPLKGLIESWPEEIKNEMASGGFQTDKIELPFSAVESGLKRGRVTVKWKTMRALLNTAAPVSPNDELELVLPLNVLAPAFLTAQKNLARPQNKVKVSQEIPNLFFGFPQPAAQTPPPTASAPASAPLPGSTPLPKTPAPNNPRPVAVVSAALHSTSQGLGDTNYFARDAIGAASDGEELFRRTPSPSTDFLNRHLHPKEVVAAAVKLPGVAGAVVAIADGLRVAGEVPPDMNADTVAAFLPQIYDRVNQSTRELRMGALNNVSFTVGNISWKIFRVSSVYFAAFGRPGESLPKLQLVSLAICLDRKNPS